MENQASDTELDYESDVDLNSSNHEDECLSFLDQDLDLDFPLDRGSVEFISRSRSSLLCLV